MTSIKERQVLSQVDLIRTVFDLYPGGVTRSDLAIYAEIPEHAISSVLPRMRKMATEIEHIPAVLKIGGVWIYGWAVAMRQHHEEHLKRCKNEKRTLRISIEMLEQSVREHPDSEVMQDRLRRARHTLEDVDVEIQRLAGVLTQLVRQEHRSK